MSKAYGIFCDNCSVGLISQDDTGTAEQFDREARDHGWWIGPRRGPVRMGGSSSVVTIQAQHICPVCRKGLVGGGS